MHIRNVLVIFSLSCFCLLYYVGCVQPSNQVYGHERRAGQEVHVRSHEHFWSQLNKQGIHTLVPAFAAETYTHKRRMKTEEKAKVVVAFWKMELIKIIVVLAIVPRTILKNGRNSSFAFILFIHPIIQLVQSKTACAARKLKNSAP